MRVVASRAGGASFVDTRPQRHTIGMGRCLQFERLGRDTRAVRGYHASLLGGPKRAVLLGVLCVSAQRDPSYMFIFVLICSFKDAHSHSAHLLAALNVNCNMLLCVLS